MKKKLSSAKIVPEVMLVQRPASIKKMRSGHCTLSDNSVDKESLQEWKSAERRASLKCIRANNTYIHSLEGKEEQEGHLITTADFLRFLKQRTGWMGRNGCLVPPDYCHEYHLERSPFSKALEKANDYLAKQGLRPDQELSLEAESRIIDNWPPEPEFELEKLRVLAQVNGQAWPVSDFKNDLKQMLQVMKKRVPIVQKAIREQGTLENLGLRLQPQRISLWGSRRQVNQKHRQYTPSSLVQMGEAGRECVCCARWCTARVMW